MSRPESPLLERPESPGTVRSAPISEPAWLKKAQHALSEDLTEPPPTIPETHDTVEESVENTETEVQQSDEPTEETPPPPAPYSISELNDQVQKLVERIEKLETGPVAETSVSEHTDISESTETTDNIPITITPEKKEETRLILASKSGRSYLPVSRNIFSSIYSRRRHN